jgi:hypothetical protein
MDAVNIWKTMSAALVFSATLASFRAFVTETLSHSM